MIPHEAIIRAQVRHWDDVFDWAGHWVRELVTRSHKPTDTVILDVGAGQGKYRCVLPEYEHVDACEVWQPTIYDERLTELYAHVYDVDVVDLVYDATWRVVPYDVTIFGDVLEHLPVHEAQSVLELVYERCDDVIVVVPYLYEQGSEGGNEYQRHLQADLTPEIMLARYPDLQLIALQTQGNGRPFKGLYRRCV